MIPRERKEMKESFPHISKVHGGKCPLPDCWNPWQISEQSWLQHTRNPAWSKSSSLWSRPRLTDVIDSVRKYGTCYGCERKLRIDVASRPLCTETVGRSEQKRNKNTHRL